jgi:hypothetical protein
MPHEVDVIVVIFAIADGGVEAVGLRPSKTSSVVLIIKCGRCSPCSHVRIGRGSKSSLRTTDEPQV